MILLREQIITAILKTHFEFKNGFSASFATFKRLASSRTYACVPYGTYSLANSHNLTHLMACRYHKISKILHEKYIS